MSLEQVLNVEEKLVDRAVEEVSDFTKNNTRVKRLFEKIPVPFREAQDVAKARAIYDWMRRNFVELKTGPTSPNLVLVSRNDNDLLGNAKRLACYQDRDISQCYVASDLGHAVVYVILAKRHGLDAHVVLYDVAIPAAERVYGVEVSVEGEEPLQIALSPPNIQGVGFGIQRKISGAVAPSNKTIAALVWAQQLRWAKLDSVDSKKRLSKWHQNLAASICHYEVALRGLGDDAPTLHDYAYALQMASWATKDQQEKAAYSKMRREVLLRIVNLQETHTLIHQNAKDELLGIYNPKPGGKN